MQFTVPLRFTAKNLIVPSKTSVSYDVYVRRMSAELVNGHIYKVIVGVGCSRSFKMIPWNFDAAYTVTKKIHKSPTSVVNVGHNSAIQLLKNLCYVIEQTFSVKANESLYNDVESQELSKTTQLLCWHLKVFSNYESVTSTIMK